MSSLTPEAKRRLQAIENFSDLGSGIHIAMQDLDIRGAGNMLGAEQSGFIADLGYETYQKILSEAVHELKTDEFADLYAEELKADGGVISGEQFVDECQVESDLELLLPADYVTGSSERMLLYRELDGLTLDKDVDAFRSASNRFGPIPPETEELRASFLATPGCPPRRGESLSERWAHVPVLRLQSGQPVLSEPGFR